MSDMSDKLQHTLGMSVEDRAAFIARLTAKQPSPMDVIRSICYGREFEVRTDQVSRTVDIECVGLSHDDAKHIAGSFTIEWRVTVNGYTFTLDDWLGPGGDL